MNRSICILTVLAVAACSEVAPHNDDDYSLLASRTDAEEAGLVAFLNDTDVSTFEVLDDDCSFHADTAWEVHSYRTGPDNKFGQGNDQTIDSEAELDAIPQVGPWHITQAYQCAADFGYIETAFCADPAPYQTWYEGSDSSWRDAVPANIEAIADANTDIFDLCGGYSSFNDSWLDKVVVEVENCEVTGYIIKWGQHIDLGVTLTQTSTFDADGNETDQFCEV